MGTSWFSKAVQSMGPCCLVVKDWCLASYPMLPMGSTKCASGGGKPTEDVESLVAGHITPQKNGSSLVSANLNLQKMPPLFSEKNWLTTRQKSLSEWICFPTNKQHFATGIGPAHMFTMDAAGRAKTKELIMEGHNRLGGGPLACHLALMTASKKSWTTFFKAKNAQSSKCGQPALAFSKVDGCQWL